MQFIEGIEALGTEDSKEGVSETGEGNVAIPALERTEFIIGEADFLFGHFKGLFNLPTGTGDLHQFVERCSGGSKAEVWGEVIGFGTGATDEKETFEAGGTGVVQG